MTVAAGSSGDRGGLPSWITPESYPWWVTIPAILGMFIVIMDSSIVNVALSPMMSDFGSNVEEIEWVSTGYMLASAVMMPTTGFLGERFGRKKLYWMAILGFTLTSMLCGAAWDANSLIAFRVLQGLVGGAIQPVAQAILFETFPPEKRGMSMAIVGIGAMFAPMIGPTVGGYLVEYLSWRWVFYINLPFGLLATFMAILVIRESKTRKLSFDAWGFILMASALSTILLALSQGNTKGWGSDYIVALFAIGAVSFGAFLIVELWRREPLLDLRLFKYPTYIAGSLTSVVVGVGLFGGMFLLPVFLQSLMGYDAIKAGLIMMPQGATVGLMMPIAGALSNRLDPRLMISIGLGLMGYSLYLQADMTPDTSTMTIIGWSVIRGIGLAFTFPPLNQTTMGAVPLSKIGQASGLLNVTRQLGGTFGITFLTVMITQRTTMHMAHLGEAMSRVQGAVSEFVSGVAARAVHLGYPVSIAAQQGSSVFGSVVAQRAQVFAYQDVFLLTAFAMWLGILPALFVVKKPGGGGGGDHAIMME